jgi:hypothetical protein
VVCPYQLWLEASLDAAGVQAWSQVWKDVPAMEDIQGTSSSGPTTPLSYNSTLSLFLNGSLEVLHSVLVYCLQ